MNNLKEIIVHLLLNNQCHVKYNNKEIYIISGLRKQEYFNYCYNSDKMLILTRFIDPIKLLSKSKLISEFGRFSRRRLYLTINDLNNLREYAKS